MPKIVKRTVGLMACIALSIVFAAGTVASQTSPSTITGVGIRGNRRIPSERIRSELQTKTGGPIDLTTVAHDIRALYSLGDFDEVQFETQSANGGLTVTFLVKEKPLVRAIDYKGIHSVTAAEIEQALVLSKKGLTPESPYSVEKANETGAVLKAFLAAKGHPEATVGIATRPLPPNSVEVVFVVDEGN